MRRNGSPPFPAFIGPSPIFEPTPLNPGHDHRQRLQSFNQPSANIRVKTAAQRPERRRTDARLQSGFAALLNSVRDDGSEAKIRSNDGKKLQPNQLLWPKFRFGISASLQSSRFAMSINTRVFTA